MAKFHLGAFAGSMHGSTKSTTFRRIKSGLVAYDRPDPHTPTRGVSSETITRNRLAFQLLKIVKVSALPIAKAGGVETKHGSTYNYLYRLLYDNLGEVWDPTSPKSPLYGKTTMEQAISFINQELTKETSAFAKSFACMKYWNLIENGLLPSQKLSNGVSGYLVEVDALARTVTIRDYSFDAAKNVEIEFIDLNSGISSVVAGETNAPIAVPDTFKNITSGESHLLGYTAIIFVKVNGKRVSASWADSFIKVNAPA